MSVLNQDRRALDDLWRQRVVDSGRTYRLAKDALDRALRDFLRTEDPDDFMQAQSAHEVAVSEYMHVLRVFHELIVNGERPPAG
jgi:hypothetical protein